MDWAVTARTTQPHVRDVISDRELETWALVDLSGSMDFGTTDLEKRDLAIAAVATIGYLTMKMGDRFGGFVLRGGQHVALARPLGPDGAARLPPEPVRQAPQRRGCAVSDLTVALEQMARANPRRGLRLVVSDFLDGVSTDESQPLPVGTGDEAPLVRHQVLA